MTRDEHRAKALALLSAASQGAIQPADPLRFALIAEAQLHATLALSAPEPAPVTTTTPSPPSKRTAAKKVAQSKEPTK